MAQDKEIIETDKNYLLTLEDIKQKIKTAQIKAHLSVNKEMLILYWQIGKAILEKQEKEGWGAKITRKLSEDLGKAFPNMKGFSYTNVRYMQRFAENYSDLLICQQFADKLKNGKFMHQTGAQIEEKAICPQAVGKLEESIFYSDYADSILSIPWGHNREILDKTKDKKQGIWYAQQTIKNGWSRNVLMLQIQSNLYDRQANKEIKTNNFQITLPQENSDLANDIFKDEYNFEFIDNAKGRLAERELEKGLVDNVIKFLTELGVGFSFVGKQYHLEVGEEDYYIDLLFYHLELRSFIVIELKTTKFKPEYAGKMAFYLSQIDKKLKKPIDNNSIGIILCPKSANKEVQETINYITKPMGVAGYELAEDKKELPKELKPIEKLKKLL